MAIIILGLNIEINIFTIIQRPYTYVRLWRRFQKLNKMMKWFCFCLCATLSSVAIFDKMILKLS